MIYVNAYSNVEKKKKDLQMFFICSCLPIFYANAQTLFTKYCSISLEKRLNSESAFQLYVCDWSNNYFHNPPSLHLFLYGKLDWWHTNQEIRWNVEIKTKQKKNLKRKKSTTEMQTGRKKNLIFITNLQIILEYAKMWFDLWEKNILKCLRILSLSYPNKWIRMIEEDATRFELVNISSVH